MSMSAGQQGRPDAYIYAQASSAGTLLDACARMRHMRWSAGALCSEGCGSQSLAKDAVQTGSGACELEWNGMCAQLPTSVRGS